MERKEFKGTWKEIWTQKGAVEGGPQDVYMYGGWEKSTKDAEEANLKIRETFEHIVKELDIKKTDRVLEVGCGAGAFAEHFGNYLEEGMYCGIDFSSSLVDKCNRFFGRGNVSAITAEANDIPFRDAYFDKVFCYGLFFYFPSKEYAAQVMSEMCRVGKSGVFIGEIAHASEHESKHLLIDKKDFDGWAGWRLSESWYPAYAKERYNATYIL